MGGVLAGKLCDKISPKIISGISLLLESISFIALIKISSALLLGVNLFLMGIAAYGFKTSNYVRTLNLCKSQSQTRLNAIGLLYAASNLGLGISGIIIGLIADFGFDKIFYISSIILFVSSSYLFIKKDYSSNHEDTPNENNSSLDKSLKKNKTIANLILICVFLIGLIIAQLSITYPLYIQSSFPLLGIKAVSILFMLDTFLIVLCQTPLTNAISKYNKILLVGIGALFMGLGMVVLSFAFHFIIAIISCVIWTTGEMIFFSTAQLVCYEKSPKKKKGSNMGTFQATFALSTIIGPTLGGIIYNQLGGATLWYLSGLIGLFCFFACYFYKKYD